MKKIFSSQISYRHRANIPRSVTLRSFRINPLNYRSSSPSTLSRFKFATTVVLYDGRNDLSYKSQSQSQLIEAASAKIGGFATSAFRRTSRVSCHTAACVRENEFVCVRACAYIVCVCMCEFVHLLVLSRAAGINVGAQYESSSIETIGNFRRRISVGSGGSAHGHSLGKLKSRQ